LRHLALRGAAVVYLGLLVALPVVAVVTKGFGDGLGTFRDAMATPAAWAAIRLTLWTSTVAAGLNAVMGTLLAWVLVRYRFPGRRLLSTLVDLPRHPDARHRHPRPLRAELDLGRFMDDLGIRVLFTPTRRVAPAVTLPLVVRNVQPVLRSSTRPRRKPPRRSAPARGPRFGAWSSRDSLGRGRGNARRSPAVWVRSERILVAGNIPKKTLTAPVFIFQLTSQFKPAEAAAVATLLFAISFVLVLVTSKLIARNEASA
jgi:sulfate transport system permease protein